MSALMEIWHSIQHIVATADWITLVIALVVIIAAGFVINSLNSVVGATFLSLVVFALLEFVRAVTLGKQDVMAYASTDWHNFTSLEMLTLLAYAIVFAVLIAVVHLIRSAVQR